MATHTRERDPVIETKQEVVETTESRQDVKEGSLALPTVYLPSGGQKACQAIPDRTDGSPGSRSIMKMLGRFTKRLAVVYDLLAATPATERGRIRNAMIRGRHDRFISFLR